MKSLHVLWLLASVAFGGCIVKEPAPYPLYPGAARSNDSVGVLVGPIATVDGQDVASRGQTFALLPGCHTFRLLQTTGEVNSGTGAGYVASLPQGTFGITVERGHYYTFQATIHEFGSPVSSGTIGFVDHERNGAVTPARGCSS